MLYRSIGGRQIVVSRNFSWFLAVVACVALAPVARADGFYLGAGIGRADFEVPGQLGVFKLDDTGYKIFAGYRFLPFLAVEGGWVDLGTAAAGDPGTRVEASAELAAAQVMGILPANPRFDLFLKLGYAAWSSKTIVEADGSRTDESGGDIAYGAGFHVRITPAFAVRFEWESFGDFKNISDVGMLSGGLSYEF
jgi:OOP family OmpA-OmpF porin